MLPSNRKDTVFVEVEDFIRRVHDGELVILPEARSIMMDVPDGKNVFGKEIRRAKSLADLLGWGMSSYQFVKDGLDVQLKSKIAYELLDYIERARAFGVIRNAKQQAKQYEEQIQQLKTENAKLKKSCTELAEENERLHKLIPHRQKGRSEVGEVG